MKKKFAPARDLLVGQSRPGEFNAPAAYAEAVELYARKSGRHATMRFQPAINCWTVEFTLRPTDGRLEAFQAGRVMEEPKEVVYLWRFEEPRDRGRPGMYVGFKLEDLGVAEMIAFLEKGNTWGRGDYRSHSQAAKHQWDKQMEARAKIDVAAKLQAVERGMDKRRTTLKIPYLGVGIDLKGGAT